MFSLERKRHFLTMCNVSMTTAVDFSVSGKSSLILLCVSFSMTFKNVGLKSLHDEPLGPNSTGGFSVMLS